jgi:membrane protease YdiL (CAAX protease family)
VVVILGGIAFGFVHYYQGIHGIVSAGLIGMFQSTIFLIDRGKLVIPIIAHGVYDSIGFMFIFFG